jgi:hypothetical protein
VCSLVAAIAFTGWMAAATQRQRARIWVEARSAAVSDHAA